MLIFDLNSEEDTVRGVFVSVAFPLSSCFFLVCGFSSYRDVYRVCMHYMITFRSRSLSVIVVVSETFPLLVYILSYCH